MDIGLAGLLSDCADKPKGQEYTIMIITTLQARACRQLFILKWEKLMKREGEF